MLVALLASRAGAGVPEAVRERERQFQESGMVWSRQRAGANGAEAPGRHRNGSGR